MRKSTQKPLPRRLEDCTISEVTARVVYRLVEIDYRADPALYEPHPFTRIGVLAEYYRRFGFGYLSFPLISLAKYLMQGGTLAGWRDDYPAYRGIRAPHKARLLRGPQR